MREGDLFMCSCLVFIRTMVNSSVFLVFALYMLFIPVDSVMPFFLLNIFPFAKNKQINKNLHSLAPLG